MGHNAGGGADPAVRGDEQLVSPLSPPTSLTSRFRLDDPEVVADPFPYYEAMRREGQVQFLAAHGFWIVLGHAEVAGAFEHPAIGSTAPFTEVDTVLLAAEPPGHSAARATVARLLSADAVNSIFAAAAAKARSLVRPELELVEEYGLPISRTVGARLIGFDEAAVAQVVAAEARAGAAARPFDAYLEQLYSLVDRASLFDALRSDAEAPLPEDRARSLVRLLWLATTTTTERVVTRAVLRLLQQPELEQAIRANRGLIPRFVEEILRLHPPEHLIPRRAKAAVELGGVEVPAGAELRLCTSAANRDPAFYDRPDQLLLDRGYRRHFSFGAGMHLCIGATLARRVIAFALETLLAGGSGLRALEPLERIPFVRTMSTLAPLRLRVRL
jgi:cytochrome P450